MGTRICPADANANADTNGIHTEINMSPFTFGFFVGGRERGGGDIILAHQ